MPITQNMVTSAAAPVRAKKPATQGKLTHHLFGDARDVRDLPQRAPEWTPRAIEARMTRLREALATSPPLVSPEASAAAHERLVGLIRELAAVSSRQHALYRRQRAAEAPIAKLTEARNAAEMAITGARAELARLEDGERAAAERWSEKGTPGTLPPQRTRERKSCEDRIEASRRDLERIDAALQKKRDALAPLVAENTRLGRDAEQLTVAILYEEAELLGHRYAATLAALGTLCAELHGINLTLKAAARATAGPYPMRGPMGAMSPAISAANDMPIREHRLTAPGFWLAAHHYQGELGTVATANAIRTAADKWASHALALFGAGSLETGEDAGERLWLIAENAELRKQLADA